MQLCIVMKVLVGSTNPVKVNATKIAFQKYFKDVEVEGLKVKSDVSNQPFNEETFIGAENRAKALKEIAKSENKYADFYVGIEGGVIKLYNKWFAFGVTCILSNNKKDNKESVNDNKEGNDNEQRSNYESRDSKGIGTSPLFELPDSIIHELKNGKELGEVIDEIAHDNNTKQKYGAIGYFTHGKITRTDFYVDGVIMALVPFLNTFLKNKRTNIKNE